MPSGGYRGRPWDDAEDEILIEFAREKWSAESQRGPVWALWTHSTRTARAAEDHWRDHVSKTPQGAAAAVAGKAAAKARLEGRDLKMEELVSQGFSWAEIEARIPPQDGKSVTVGALASYWSKSVVCTLSAAKKAAANESQPRGKGQSRPRLFDVLSAVL
jgi:hypothetical protein